MRGHITHIVIILLLIVLSCTFSAPIQTSAFDLIQSKDKCSKVRVRIDASSIKEIFLRPEGILKDRDVFWESDYALKSIKGTFEMLKRPVPYEEWENKIAGIAGLSAEERARHPYYLASLELEQRAEYFNTTAVPYICRYLPDSLEVEYTITAYITAYVGGYRFMLGNDLFINIDHENWKGSSEKILNNLAMVVFDAGYEKCKLMWTEKPPEDRYYRLIQYLQQRGIATYAGYKAREILPADGVNDYALLEDDGEIVRLRNSLNGLFTNAAKMTGDELRRSASEIGIRGRAYTVVGAYMARLIDENLGRKGLIETLVKGPRSFVAAYNGLVGEGKKIFEFAIGE